jgi:putative tricarboxylic transport membrane protein
MAVQSNGSGSNSLNSSRWVIPGLIILFCVVAFYFTTQFDRVPEILKRGIQPSDFPQLILLLLIGLACLLPFEKIQHNRPAIPPSVFISLLLIIIFVLLTNLDFFIALGCFGGLLSFSWGERRLGALFLVTLFFPTFVFFLFDLVFEVRFPRGLLTNLWYG